MIRLTLIALLLASAAGAQTRPCESNALIPGVVTSDCMTVCWDAGSLPGEQSLTLSGTDELWTFAPLHSPREICAETIDGHEYELIVRVGGVVSAPMSFKRDRDPDFNSSGQVTFADFGKARSLDDVALLRRYWGWCFSGSVAVECQP